MTVDMKREKKKRGGDEGGLIGCSRWLSGIGASRGLKTKSPKLFPAWGY
jgi:hypothetical protein